MTRADARSTAFRHGPSPSGAVPALVAALALALPAAAAPPEVDEPVQAALAEAAELRDLVERVERRYAEMGPFRSRFVQHSVSQLFGTDEEARGVVHVVPPDRMLWEYEQPQGQRAGFDEGTWWLVDPELRDVTVREGGDEIIADLLTGTADLLDLFAVRRAVEPAAADDHVVLELVPRETRDDLDVVLLEIDPQPGDVRRVALVDPLGNRWSYLLGPPRPEDPLPVARFRLQVPEGYTITRE
jgi:outer membrane lipoprotein-sorting protein